MIAKAIADNVMLRQEVVHQLCKICRKEIQKICSDTHDSILRMKSKVALEHFSWETVWLEMENNAPLLVAFFKQLFPPHKKEDQSTTMAICVCISILLQAQNSKDQPCPGCDWPSVAKWPYLKAGVYMAIHVAGLN